jgi:hypothetical protein
MLTEPEPEITRARVNIRAANEHLYCLIVNAGGKRPPEGLSEDHLRNILRCAIEAKLDTDDPIANYEVAQ